LNSNFSPEFCLVIDLANRIFSLGLNRISFGSSDILVDKIWFGFRFGSVNFQFGYIFRSHYRKSGKLWRKLRQKKGNFDGKAFILMKFLMERVLSKNWWSKLKFWLTCQNCDGKIVTGCFSVKIILTKDFNGLAICQNIFWSELQRVKPVLMDKGPSQSIKLSLRMINFQDCDKLSWRIPSKFWQNSVKISVIIPSWPTFWWIIVCQNGSGWQWREGILTEIVMEFIIILTECHHNSVTISQAHYKFTIFASD